MTEKHQLCLFIIGSSKESKLKVGGSIKDLGLMMYEVHRNNKNSIFLFGPIM